MVSRGKRISLRRHITSHRHISIQTNLAVPTSVHLFSPQKSKNFFLLTNSFRFPLIFPSPSPTKDFFSRDAFLQGPSPARQSKEDEENPPFNFPSFFPFLRARNKSLLSKARIFFLQLNVGNFSFPKTTLFFFSFRKWRVFVNRGLTGNTDFFFAHVGKRGKFSHMQGKFPYSRIFKNVLGVGPTFTSG